MSKINEFNTRLKIRHNGNIYKIGMIGYTKDYGYNIQDFSCFDEQNYIASKFKVQGGTKGNVENGELNKDNTYNVSISKPKISHHFDGKAHISGRDITSGYFNDGSAKGLSVKSFDLSSKNDGGPIFIFNVGSKAIEKFKIEEKINNKKMQLIFMGDKIDDYRQKKHDFFDYVIEGYYIHKKDFERNEKTAQSMNIGHPNFGTIEVYPIAFPRDIPGVIFIYIYKDDTHDKGEHFSITGAPGIKDSKGNWEILGLISNVSDNNIYPSLNRQ